MADQSPEDASRKKRIAVRLFAAAFAGVAAWVLGWAAMRCWDAALAPADDNGMERVVRGRVLSRHKAAPIVSVRLEEEPRRGEVVSARLEPHRAASVRSGRACLVSFEKHPDGSPIVKYLGPVRERLLLSLIAFVVALGVLVMGRTGLATFGSVVLGAALVIGGLMPLVLRGWSPTLAAGCIAVPVCVAGLILVGGANRKSLSAVMGCSAALLLAAWLPWVSSRWLALTGLEVGFGRHFHLDVGLWYSRPLAAVDFSGLLVAGMILSGLGATMDVSMCVASSVFAVPSNGAQTTKRFFRVGLGVGRDVLGMMAITIVLVVIGTHFEMLFLVQLAGSKETWAAIANLEEVAGEVARIVSAVIALGLSVPLTSCAAAVMRRSNGSSA